MASSQQRGTERTDYRGLIVLACSALFICAAGCHRRANPTDAAETASHLATFGGTTQIKLLAVSRLPDQPNRLWRPDGAPSTYPIVAPGLMGSNAAALRKRARILTFAISGSKIEDLTICGYAPGAESPYTVEASVHVAPTKPTYVAISALPPDTKSENYVLGVAAGPWKPVAQVVALPKDSAILAQGDWGKLHMQIDKVRAGLLPQTEMKRVGNGLRKQVRYVRLGVKPGDYVRFWVEAPKGPRRYATQIVATDKYGCVDHPEQRQNIYGPARADIAKVTVKYRPYEYRVIDGVHYNVLQ